MPIRKTLNSILLMLAFLPSSFILGQSKGNINTQQNQLPKDSLISQFRKFYDVLFEPELPYYGILINSNEDQTKATNFISDYETKIQEFISSDCAILAKDQWGTPAIEYISHLAIRARMGFNLNFYTPTGKNQVLTDYYKLKLQLSWANGLIKLFGELEEIIDHKTNIDACLSFLKSPEEAVLIAEKNAYDYKASAKLFPEAMFNEKLLTDIRAAVENSSFGKGITIKKLCVTNSQWTIERHWLTGVILFRHVHIQMITTENNQCFLHDFRATEDFNGSTYDKCYVGYHNVREMLCSNVH